MGHLYHGYVSHNQRVLKKKDGRRFSPDFMISPVPKRCQKNVSAPFRTSAVTGYLGAGLSMVSRIWGTTLRSECWVLECLSACRKAKKKDQIWIKSDSDKISQDITRYVRKGIHKRNADVTRMRLQHFGDRDPNILRKLRCCVAESFWIADIATIWLFVP